ncbi:DUF1214 domain-containing protein [Novosphingobium sp. THN1]|uniref:DUF1214 domain-containing protein n=1 Tax=Novosphingobium sp. THN1 TaxID=1016987 RepID=UPI0013C2AE87|nr:DUF1214 domain-containing protein [Novosphingobium sp. THN1]
MIAVATIGLAVGAASAVVSLKHVGMGGEEHMGWSGSRVTGSTEAGPVLRARVALTGLLALNRSQAIYFTRTVDDLGEPLREECHYRLVGGPLPGKWWSITAYASDDYLPQNQDDALSVDASEVTPDKRGIWEAEVGPSPNPAMPWLSTRHAGSFDLTLRIYNPSQQAQQDFGSIVFPKVERISCGDSR